MTTRLQALEDRTDGTQSFGLTNYDQLQADVDYLVVPGANLTSLGGSNTLTITNEWHQVTLAAGNNIDNIADALNAVAGPQVRLAFTNYQTVRNNGGGTGNIRTESGGDEYVMPNEIVTLTFDGTNWWKSKKAVFTVVRDASLVDIVSSTTETDLIGVAGTGIALPGGMLGTSRKFSITLNSDFLANVSGTVTFRVYYGSASMASDAIGVSTPAATRRSIVLNADIAADGATNTQMLQGITHLTFFGGNGYSPFGLPASNATKGWVDGTVDSTVAQNLRVTAQLSASSASLEFRKRYIEVEVI